MYLPLQFAENFKLPYESPNQLVRMLSALISEGRSDEVLMFMRSKWFMDPDADCPERHKPFQEFCLHYRRYILSDLGHFPEDLIQAFWEDTKKRRDSVSDIISPYLILDEWSRSKQVYCFDPEMEIALADTDEVAVGPGVMDRLPFKVFYIEFHRDGIFSSGCHGTFVKVAKDENGNYGVIFMRCKHDISYHLGGCTLLSGKDTRINRITDCPAEGEVSFDWPEFSMFAINALLYLCSVNNQVEENPTTRSTYRPYVKPRNKFSEIRKWDVGVRYGDTVRMNRKEIGGAGNTEENTGTEVLENLRISRKSPRAHLRRAHWQRYRVGPGRKEIVMKWIEPVFVGSGEITAVKHRVHESSEETM